MDTIFKVIFKVTVPKGKFKAFESDWELIGQPLKEKCEVRYSKTGSETGFIIEVNNELVAEVLATDVFGEKGFLTRSGWQSSTLA